MLTLELIPRKCQPSDARVGIEQSTVPGEGRPELTLRLAHPLQVQEGSAKTERLGLQNMELAPVQRKIEARSAEDSFTGFVRTLYFADTYLRDSE